MGLTAAAWSAFLQSKIAVIQRPQVVDNPTPVCAIFWSALLFFWWEDSGADIRLLSWAMFNISRSTDKSEAEENDFAAINVRTK